MPSSMRNKPVILDARITIPDDVVHRTFAAETVVLNLESGKYHGLNPTGGHMFEVLAKVGSVREAAGLLADEYGRPFDEIASDLCGFCLDLERRGLIVLSADA